VATCWGISGPLVTDPSTSCSTRSATGTTTTCAVLTVAGAGRRALLPTDPSRMPAPWRRPLAHPPRPATCGRASRRPAPTAGSAYRTWERDLITLPDESDWQTDVQRREPGEDWTAEKVYRQRDKDGFPSLRWIPRQHPTGSPGRRWAYRVSDRWGWRPGCGRAAEV